MRCFLDSAGAYDDWSEAFYGTNMNAAECCKDENGESKRCNGNGLATNQACERTTRQYYYCCGYMVKEKKEISAKVVYVCLGKWT